MVDDLRKENFDLKLKLYNVEEQLRRFNGTQLEGVLEQVSFTWSGAPLTNIADALGAE